MIITLHTERDRERVEKTLSGRGGGEWMQGNRITVLQQEESESWIIGGLDYSWRVE